jgi:hypothetical protein
MGPDAQGPRVELPHCVSFTRISLCGKTKYLAEASIPLTKYQGHLTRFPMELNPFVGC